RGAGGLPACGRACGRRNHLALRKQVSFVRRRPLAARHEGLYARPLLERGSMQRTVGKLKRPFGNLHYEVTGSGPALVFAHGLGGNHLSWWQQVAHFAPHYTCVAFAHRGFAPSDPIAGGPDAADYRGDLEALIDHLRLSDVRLVGQSMGGWTMLEYAL